MSEATPILNPEAAPGEAGAPPQKAAASGIAGPAGDAAATPGTLPLSPDGEADPLLASPETEPKTSVASAAAAIAALDSAAAGAPPLLPAATPEPSVGRRLNFSSPREPAPIDATAAANAASASNGTQKFDLGELAADYFSAPTPSKQQQQQQEEAAGPEDEDEGEGPGGAATWGFPALIAPGGRPQASPRAASGGDLLQDSGIASAIEADLSYQQDLDVTGGGGGDDGDGGLDEADLGIRRRHMNDAHRMEAHRQEIANRDARMNWMARKMQAMETELLAARRRAQQGQGASGADAEAASGEPGRILSTGEERVGAASQKGAKDEDEDEDETASLRQKLKWNDAAVAAQSELVERLRAERDAALAGASGPRAAPPAPASVESRTEFLVQRVELARLRREVAEGREREAEGAAERSALRGEVERLTAAGIGAAEVAAEVGGDGGGGEPGRISGAATVTDAFLLEQALGGEGPGEGGDTSSQTSDEMMGDLTDQEPSDEWADSIAMLGGSRPVPVEELQRLLREAKERESAHNMQLAEMRLRDIRRKKEEKEGTTLKGEGWQRTVKDLQEECSLFASQLLASEEETRRLRAAVSEGEASSAVLKRQLILLRNKLIADNEAAAPSSRDQDLELARQEVTRKTIRINAITEEVNLLHQALKNHEDNLAAQKTTIQKLTAARIDEVAAVEDERDKQKKLLNDKRRVRFNKGTNDESATEDSAADVTTEFGDVEVDGTKPTPGTEEDARDVFTATLSKGLDSIQSASLAAAEEVSSLWDQNSVTNCTQSIMTMLNVDAEK